MTFSKSEHQIMAYSELAFHPSEEIHCTDISPLMVSLLVWLQKQ